MHPHPNTIQTKRPGFFVFLSVFTIIISVFLVMLGIAGIIYSNKVFYIFNEFAPGNGSLGRNTLLISSFFLLIIFGMKLWGNIFMFYGKKSGYILYLLPTGIWMIALIVMLFATFYYGLGLLLLFEIVFVLLFGRYFRYMI
jgi:hypothetical protein